MVEVFRGNTANKDGATAEVKTEAYFPKIWTRIN